MKKEDLYDVLIGMDSKYIDEGICVLEKKNVRKEVKTRRLTWMSATALTIIVVFSIVLSVILIPNKNSSQDPQIIEGIKSTLISTEKCESSSFSGSLSKPTVGGYYVWMSSLACVEINSDFFIECALGDMMNRRSYGLTDEEIDSLDREYGELGPSAMGNYWRITSYTYETTYESENIFINSEELNFDYTSKQSDLISFFGESDYKEDITLDRMKKEFVFDDSHYRNEYDSKLLPYNVKVPVQIGTIDNGVKGRIITTFGFKYPDGQQGGNGAYLCYYVNGNFIGFGLTEEEAYNNSFLLMSENLDIGAFDTNTQRRKTRAEN